MKKYDSYEEFKAEVLRCFRNNEPMPRTRYTVKSYDGKIVKEFKNYKSAYNFCNKLIAKDINCGIWFDGDCIIGC